jgi:DNA-binding IclR family transcriptional regulator
MADIVQSLSALGLSQKQIRAQLGMCTEEVKRLLETLPLQKQVTRDNGTELQKAWTPKPGFVDYLET